MGVLLKLALARPCSEYQLVDVAAHVFLCGIQSSRLSVRRCKMPDQPLLTLHAIVIRSAVSKLQKRCDTVSARSCVGREVLPHDLK